MRSILHIILPNSGQLTLSLSLCLGLPRLKLQRAFKRVCQSFENKPIRLNGYYANCIGYFDCELNDIVDCL